MKNRKFKSSILYFISLILIILLNLFIYNIYNLSKKENVLKEMEYYSTDLSKYEVYYNDQKVNEDGYIKKYTTKVNMNFDYSLIFSDIVNGEIESLVKATLVVYAPNSETEIYRSNSEYLEKATKIKYDDAKEFKVNKSIAIDYEKYLNMYNSFKTETSIISDAKILVEFNSSAIVNNDYFDRITKNDSITYEIPVSEVTYNIEKKSTISSNRKKVRKLNKENEKTKKYQTYIIESIIAIVIILCIDIIRFMSDKQRKGLYYNKLEKILKTYDNIIVNVKELPDIENKSLVNVTTFEELVDAQMEVRIPINYLETIKGKKSVFLIVSRDIVWVYVLEKSKVKCKMK